MFNIKFKKRNIVSLERHDLVNDNHYRVEIGQAFIVKEMSVENVIGGIVYDREMKVVKITKNHITLQDGKETSKLTGGSAEYCFPIEEIGKNIFPK